MDAGARVQAQLLAEQGRVCNHFERYPGTPNVSVRRSEVSDCELAREPCRNWLGRRKRPLRRMRHRQRRTPRSFTRPWAECSSARLGVSFADLYRRVRVQETLYELLTQQYEMVRIEEAKDLPGITVIDAPGIAEKKSFPPRLWVTSALTFFTFAVVSPGCSAGITGRKWIPAIHGRSLLQRFFLCSHDGLRWLSAMKRRRA